MLGRVGIHQRGGLAGLADIVDEFDNFLAGLIQRGNNIFTDFRGDRNGALDANDVVASLFIGKEIDEADRGVLDLAVGGNALEHGGLQIGAGGSGIIGVGDQRHTDVLAGGIAVIVSLL